MSDKESDMEKELAAPDFSSVDAEALQICCTIAAFILTWQYYFFLSNNVVSALLAFLKVLFTILNKVVQSPFIDHMIKVIPTSVAMCRKLLKTDREWFTKYSLCVKVP